MTITDARKAVGKQIGLPLSFDGSISAYRNLSASDQTSLTAALIRYITQNPGSFTDAQVQTAQTQLGQAGTLSIEDTGFDFGMFMDELENNAVNTLGAPLSAVGSGVSTTVKMLGTLLPIAALVALVIFALPYLKKSVKT